MIIKYTFPDHTWYNMCVTSFGNKLIANTNDSVNWDTLDIKLPDGKWKITSIDISDGQKTVSLMKQT